MLWQHFKRKNTCTEALQECRDITSTSLTFEATGAKHLAQSQTDKTGDVMAVLIIISIGLDVNSCSGVVSHSVAHAFSDIGNDGLIRRLELQESFNNGIELNQQLAVFFVRAV